MSAGVAAALSLVILVLIAIPSARLGKRLGTPEHVRTASPEEKASLKRDRADRRKADLAALTGRERVVFYTYYALSIPATPAGLALTVFGRGTTRTVGLAVLAASVLLMAVPVGPILGARVKRGEAPDADGGGVSAAARPNDARGGPRDKRNRLLADFVLSR
ncbi:MAG TPA: hypothetical protein VHT27_04860 [Solirubrobacteraceae bacterium]|jgi:hypothetical protein|nr:hypothetical protein [Solirubrobacteraceae bacterium]